MQARSIGRRAAVRVLIAEDLALLRDGLTRLLRDNGFDVVGAVDNADALVHAARAEKPDIAIAINTIAAVPVVWHVVPNERDAVNGVSFDAAKTTIQTVVYRRFTKGYGKMIPNGPDVRARVPRICWRMVSASARHNSTSASFDVSSSVSAPIASRS